MSTNKPFSESTTIQAGLDVAKDSSTLATIGIAAGSLAPILLSDLGVSEPINNVLSGVFHGAISGQSIEAIAVGAGLTAMKHVLEKRRHKKLAEQIIDGRINAAYPIDKMSIPADYQG